MSRFIESVRFEYGRFHLLDYHQERIDRTFLSFYSGQSSIQLKEILPDFSQRGKHKFSITYDSKTIQIKHCLYEPKSIESMRIMNADLDYSFKFEDRSELQKLLNKSGTDEIIIIKNELITDSSYSNLAFFDGSDWWTPEQPILAGVRRACLLNKNQIKKTRIDLADLSNFKKISLINSMLDLGELEIPSRKIG